MRRIVYFVAISLDGFIARRDGSVDWLFHDQDYGFTDFFKNVETVVQGRRTYEQVLTFGKYPYQGKNNVVFSRRLKNCEHGTVVSMPAAEFAAEERRKSGGDIWVVGGGDLAGSFLSAGAIDDVVVFVHPILLGDGLPLSPGLQSDVRLSFNGSSAFDSGLVKLSYQVVNRSKVDGRNEEKYR